MRSKLYIAYSLFILLLTSSSHQPLSLSFCALLISSEFSISWGDHWSFLFRFTYVETKRSRCSEERVHGKQRYKSMNFSMVYSHWLKWKHHLFFLDRSVDLFFFQKEKMVSNFYFLILFLFFFFYFFDSLPLLEVSPILTLGLPSHPQMFLYFSRYLVVVFHHVCLTCLNLTSCNYVLACLEGIIADSVPGVCRVL